MRFSLALPDSSPMVLVDEKDALDEAVDAFARDQAIKAAEELSLLDRKCECTITANKDYVRLPLIKLLFLAVALVSQLPHFGLWPERSTGKTCELVDRLLLTPFRPLALDPPQAPLPLAPPVPPRYPRPHWRIPSPPPYWLSSHPPPSPSPPPFWWSPPPPPSPSPPPPYLSSAFPPSPLPPPPPSPSPPTPQSYSPPATSPPPAAPHDAQNLIRVIDVSPEDSRLWPFATTIKVVASPLFCYPGNIEIALRSSDQLIASQLLSYPTGIALSCAAVEHTMPNSTQFRCVVNASSAQQSFGPAMPYLTQSTLAALQQPFAVTSAVAPTRMSAIEWFSSNGTQLNVIVNATTACPKCCPDAAVGPELDSLEIHSCSCSSSSPCVTWRPSYKCFDVTCAQVALMLVRIIIIILLRRDVKREHREVSVIWSQYDSVTGRKNNVKVVLSPIPVAGPDLTLYNQYVKFRQILHSKGRMKLHGLPKNNMDIEAVRNAVQREVERRKNMIRFIREVGDVCPQILIILAAVANAVQFLLDPVLQNWRCLSNLPLTTIPILLFDVRCRRRRFMTLVERQQVKCEEVRARVRST